MNTYEQLEMINDRHFTNTIKCDILSNNAEIVEADKHVRLEGMNKNLKNEKLYVHDVKKDVRTYHQLIKKIHYHNNDVLLADKENRILVERYKSLSPHRIKLITTGFIYNIVNRSNKLAKKIQTRKDYLKNIERHLLEKEDDVIKDTKTHEIMEIKKIEKKRALLDMYNRKTHLMVDFAKENLVTYDTVIEQLQNNIGLMGIDIIKELQIGTFFKEDESNFIQSYIDEKTETENRINKGMQRVNQLSSIMDSLERSRKALMTDNMVTETEKEYYMALPWAAIKTHDDEHSNSSSLSSKPKASVLNNEEDCLNDIIQLGIMQYLIDDEERNESFDKLDYTVPESIMDYKTISDTAPSKNEIAVDYVLQQLEYNNNTDDVLNSIEFTKYNLVKLNTMKAVRTKLLDFLVKKNSNIQETLGNFNSTTNEDIKFNEQLNNMKLVTEDQHKKLSDLEKTKNHYLALLSDVYFYLNNVRNILKKVDFSSGNIKRYSDQIKEDKTVGSSNTELTAFIQDLKLMVKEINKKIRWCNRIIPDNFDPNKMNLARAIYMYKVRAHIDNDCLRRESKNINHLKKIVSITDFTKNPEPILTREDTKKLAEEIVAYYNEKDQDRSKNKRKPISFRKSFI